MTNPPSGNEGSGVTAVAGSIDRTTIECDDPVSRREQRLLAAQELSGLGSWEYDVEQNVVDWSDELYRIYGLEPGMRLTVEGYLSRVHPDDRERVRGLIVQSLRTGERFQFEERIVRPSGEVRVLRSMGAPTCAADGRVVRLVGACQDITDARTLEEDLRRSEAAYRAMFELAADAIFVHDLTTGAILDANLKAFELHGFSLEELREGGVALITQNDPKFTQALAGQVMERAAAGEPQMFEWHGRHRAGHSVWTEVRLVRITSPAGDRLLAIVRDITERKRAERELKEAHDELEQRVQDRTAELARINEALRAEIAERQRSELALQRSEEHFRALIEHSSDLASVLDTEGKMVYLSASIERLLGWKAEELLGHHAFDYLHPDEHERVGSELQALFADPTTTRVVDFRYLHKDGTWLDMEATGRGLTTPEFTGAVINSRDITERRAAEDELRRQTALLRAQGEASIDGILVIDPAGRILSYNQRFVELWGIPDDVVQSGSDADAIACVLDRVADPAAFVSRIEYLYANVDESSVDEIPLKDGRVLDRFSGPVHGADGTYYGRVWSFRDITERKRSETALHQARVEAEEARELAERADRAKSEFLSRMSHELRTPLNSILGFAQLLQRKELPPDQVKAVEYILRGGRHLLNLINEVLEIARIESGPQSLSLEPVRRGPDVSVAGSHGDRAGPPSSAGRHPARPPPPGPARR